MKVIISETQINNIGLDKKADAIYYLMNSLYPNNREEYNETTDDTNIYGDESEDYLLLYYRWNDNDLYVGISFINDLFSRTGLPFLNYEEIRTNKREMFNDIIKIFAKRHYGWNVRNVLFHWH